MLMLLLLFAFHDQVLSQQPVEGFARYSSEMPTSKHVNGHSFRIYLMVFCTPQSWEHTLVEPSLHIVRTMQLHENNIMI